MTLGILRRYLSCPTGYLKVGFRGTEPRRNPLSKCRPEEIDWYVTVVVSGCYKTGVLCLYYFESPYLS